MLPGSRPHACPASPVGIQEPMSDPNRKNGECIRQCLTHICHFAISFTALQTTRLALRYTSKQTASLFLTPKEIFWAIGAPAPISPRGYAQITPNGRCG